MPTSPPAIPPRPPAPAPAVPPPPRPRPRPARTAVFAVLASCLVLSLVPEAVTEPASPYSPPVEAPILEGYRAPATPFGPGNRGLDYATTAGDEVRAAADGEVTFAGRVGAGLHVVVLHPDGIRTSYSFLATAAVRRGQRVSRGEVVGTAGPSLHFGARAGDRYLDPSLLLSGGPVEVHLIPVELRAPASEAQERRWLRDLVGNVVAGARRVVGAGVDAAGLAMAWARAGAEAAVGDMAALARLAAATGWEALKAELGSRWQQLVVLAAYAEQLPISPAFVLHALELWKRASGFRDAQGGCTPPSQPPPAPPPGRRIAVLVSGFGSSSDDAGVLAVDTAALGYAPADVVQFSYAGGHTEGRGDVPGVPVRDYGPEDATGDLRVSGRRLRALLQAVSRENPGVPIDVIAHSQGGVVARLGLGPGGDGAGSAPPPVANLVTLGSPHHGADVATATALVGTTTVGWAAQLVADEVSGGRVDGSSVAAGQLAETSRLVAELDALPLPEGTRVTSLAASGDLVVAALNSSLEGATNVLVPLGGVGIHRDLPGSAEALREMQLALAGLGPTCRHLGEELALAAGIGMVEDGIGFALGVGALWADHAAPGPSVPVRTPGPVPPIPAPRPAPAGAGR